MHENQAFDRYLVATQCANISQSNGWQGVLSRRAHMLATRKPLLGTHKQRHTIKNSSERNECAVLAAFSMANINRPVSNRTSFHLVHSAAEQSLTARTNSLQAFFLRCKSRELCGAPRNAEPTCSVALGDRRWRLRSTRSKSATMAKSSQVNPVCLVQTQIEKLWASCHAHVTCTRYGMTAVFGLVQNPTRGQRTPNATGRPQPLTLQGWSNG